MHVHTTKQLLTLGALARRADVPAMRVSRLVKSGLLVPDFEAGAMKLFNPDRLPELQTQFHPGHIQS